MRLFLDDVDLRFQFVDQEGEFVRVVKALLGLESVLEQLARDELAVKIDGVHLGDLVILYRSHLNNVSHNLREYRQIDRADSLLGDVVQKVYEVAEEALAFCMVVNVDFLVHCFIHFGVFFVDFFFQVILG